MEDLQKELNKDSYFGVYLIDRVTKNWNAFAMKMVGLNVRAHIRFNFVILVIELTHMDPVKPERFFLHGTWITSKSTNTIFNTKKLFDLSRSFHLNGFPNAS